MTFCPPCRQAGELNTLANQQAEAQRGFSGDLLRSMAKQKHDECPGANWCDCQHFIGQALNTIEVAKITTVELPSSEPPAETVITASLEGSPMADVSDVRA